MKWSIPPSARAEQRWAEILQGKIPLGAVGYTAHYMSQLHIELRYSRSRSTKYGDYRLAGKDGLHRISVNADLPPHRFLWTLIHELAHAEVHQKYGRTVSPHGREWKACFRYRMSPLLKEDIIPSPLLSAMQVHLQRVKATVQADPELHAAFAAIEGAQSTLVKDIPLGDAFRLPNGRRFIGLEKKRTRMLCKDMGNKRRYLVPLIAEAEPIPR